MYFVKTTDDVKIAVYDFNPQWSQTVFLVHGWPLSHKIYEYQIGQLTQLSYRVVAVDLRGFGNSDTPAFGYSYDQMARDIHCVVSTLQLADFTLVGFSMGGAIVLRYMRLYEGAGVKKLVLLSAAAPVWTRRPGYPFGHTLPYVNELISQAATDRAQLAHMFCHEQLFAMPQSEAIKNWFQEIAWSASGIGTVQCAISLRDEDGRRDLPYVHVPTAIIHGAKDQVVSSDLVNLQHRGIAQSQLFTLKDSGHGIMYDELEKFNRIFFSVI